MSTDTEHTTNGNGTQPAAAAGDLLARATACADRITAAAKEVDTLTRKLADARDRRDAAVAEGESLMKAAGDLPGVGAYVRDLIKRAKPTPASKAGRR